MRYREIIEAWSAKYKRSINCNNPKGFSQRAHCQGRKKNEDMALEAVYPGNLGMMELAQFLRQHPEHRQRYQEIKSQQGVRAALKFVLKKLNVKLSGDPYRAVAEDKSQYKEIEFVCVNPKFPNATDPELQKKMYQGLTKIPGVIPLWQEWGDYSEGQASLAAIYKDPAVRKQVLALAKQLGVKVDLEQPVSDDYVDHAIRGEHEGQQRVTEGRISDIDIDLQDQQWEAVVGFVQDGVRRGRDTDRMSIDLYRWAGGEQFDVDEELERRGFSSVADLADHIREHGGRYRPPEFDLSSAGSLQDIERLERRRDKDWK